MSSELTFRTISLGVFIILGLIRGYYGVRIYRVRKASGEKFSAWERLGEMKREGKLGVALIILFSFWFGVLIIYAIYPKRVACFALPLPVWLRWMGVGLGMLGPPLLIWVHHTLGRYWTTTLGIREKHKLVTSGPYRWVRHPMYTVHFTFVTGLSLASANWLVILLGVAAMIMIHLRIGNEEAMMIEQFGDEYRDYMKRTGRLLPRFTREED